MQMYGISQNNNQPPNAFTSITTRLTRQRPSCAAKRLPYPKLMYARHKLRSRLIVSAATVYQSRVWAICARDVCRGKPGAASTDPLLLEAQQHKQQGQ